MRGLNSIVDAFYASVSDGEFDIQVHRRDSKLSQLSKVFGGGVLIEVRNIIKSVTSTMNSL